MPIYGRLFQNGRSQAVRLPAEFRFRGDRVRITRLGQGVLLEPVSDDAERWLAELERYRDTPFMAEGRRQPPLPERDLFP
jgi:antitoxin VapB